MTDMVFKDFSSPIVQPWMFFGRSDAKAETPILWPPHAKSWLIGKDSDAGRDWGQEEKGTTEDEMVGWHHRLSGWVWVNPGSWWWTGRPGVLQFMGSQRVWHNWATELNWCPAFMVINPIQCEMPADIMISSHSLFLSLSLLPSLPAPLPGSSCLFFLLLVL